MLAAILGGWEILLILCVVLILSGAKRMPDLMHGFRKGWDEFWTEFGNFTPIDREAEDAGRSIGGIYGKRAAEALTPKNRVAELYDPAVFEKDHNAPRKNLLVRLCSWLREQALRLLRFFR